MTTSPVQKLSYSYGLDHTGSLQAPDGLLQLSGWIAGISERGSLVRLRIGQDAIFDCQTAIPRSDVVEVHPMLAGGKDSGFTLATCIPAGFHIGTLEYSRPGYVDWTPFHTLSVLSELSPLCAQLEVEAPAQESREGWQVRGWCFHPQSEIESLTVQFGLHQCPLKHDLPRTDVSERFPQYRTARDCGFSGQLQFGPGQAPVMLTALLRNGSRLQHCLLPELHIPNRELQKVVQSARAVRAECLRFAAHPAPVVSIIIPIFNQLDLTLACLESLVRHAGKITFEVIIIDDKSEPQVGETLSLVRNLRLIANQSNQGFVLNCNRGAMEAKGVYLLFLNNDTEVCAGWLEALVGTFAEHPQAGAVGAKLIYPDGSLQEAGAIIWEDGSGHNFGNRDDADRPEYNYLRQVDYCSGACLMVPRALFHHVGGFDTLFCPAYYEDTDLAFAIRAAGREVYYQPEAVIIHHEGASSGTDIRTGPKKHQVINQARFAKKWAAQLTGLGADHSLASLARDRHAIGRILVIDACALTPDMDAGSVRMFNLLNILARQGCKVSFAAENLQFHEPYSSQLRHEGVEHLGVPAIYDLDLYLEKHAYEFDIIILSRKYVAERFLQLIRRYAPRTKIIFDTVDLMFMRFFRQAEVEKSEKIRQEAEASRRAELELCATADLTYVVSQEEAEILAADIPRNKIAVVPLIHDTAPAGPLFAEREGILFVGGYQHPPNLDAIEYFLDEILPRLSDRLPGLPVHIVGSNTPERLKKRASQQVIVHGYVANLDDLLDRVRLSIAPLRFGAGVKGKVNQSMAHGVPVVATSMATDGMHLVDGRNVLVGDTPAAFADALHRIYTDVALWNRIAAAGRENIEEHFSFSAVRKKLMDSLLDQVPDLLAPRRALPHREVARCELNQVLYFGRQNTAEPFLEGGWSEPAEDFRWATGRKARLRLRFGSEQKPTRAHLVLFPLLVPGRVERQRVNIELPAGTNPQVLEMTRREKHEFVVQLPPSESLSEILTLQLGFPDACVPHELGLSADMRHLSVAFMQVTFS